MKKTDSELLAIFQAETRKLSHAFNNALMGITGNAYLIKEEAGDNKDLEISAKHILESSELLGNYYRRLLELSADRKANP